MILEELQGRPCMLAPSPCTFQCPASHKKRKLISGRPTALRCAAPAFKVKVSACHMLLLLLDLLSLAVAAPWPPPRGGMRRRDESSIAPPPGWSWDRCATARLRVFELNHSIRLRQKDLCPIARKRALKRARCKRARCKRRELADVEPLQSDLTPTPPQSIH